MFLTFGILESNIYGKMKMINISPPPPKKSLKRSSPAKSKLSKSTKTIITKAKKSISKLSKLKEFNEALIRTLKEPFVVLDDKLNVVMANRSFYLAFKVSKKDIEKKVIYEIGNDQWDIPKLRELIENIVPQNTHFSNFEVEHDFPHIGKKIMLLNAHKFRQDGEHILLAFEDITEKKALQQQKDDFVNLVSHELKTPITSMKAYLYILQKRLNDSGDKQDIYLLENVEKQANRLTSLLTELLQAGKVESGKFPPHKKQFDLNVVVKKVVSDFQYTVDTHTLKRTGEIKQKVHGDARRLEQVLINLLTNAIKYSPEADRVNVNVSEDKDYATVSVRDFGIGIAKKDLSKIFERYYRADKKNAINTQGFGLGLYISSEIIKQQDGEIWVESTKSKGSTFYFTIPIEHSPEARSVRPHGS